MVGIIRLHASGEPKQAIASFRSDTMLSFPKSVLEQPLFHN